MTINYLAIECPPLLPPLNGRVGAGSGHYVGK